MPFQTGVSTDVLAVHAALIPRGDRGRILIFGGSEHHGDFSEEDVPNPGEGDAWKKTEVYDVATGDLLDITIPSPSSDVFCSGHAFLADGRLIIGGGTIHYGGHGPHGDHDLGWGGHRKCWIYNPTDNEWQRAADMRFEPGREAGGGRWYPTLLTLGNGQVIAFFGHPDNSDTRHRTWFPSALESTDVKDEAEDFPDLGERCPVHLPLTSSNHSTDTERTC